MIFLILKKGIALALDLFTAAILFMPVSLVMHRTGVTEKLNKMDSHGDIFALIFFLIILFYPVVMEFKFHATLGHMAVGLKIVRADGTRITFLTVLKRRLPDIVELFLTSCLIAIVLNLITDGYRRLGDLWANTVVIEKKSENIV